MLISITYSRVHRWNARDTDKRRTAHLRST